MRQGSFHGSGCRATVCDAGAASVKELRRITANCNGERPAGMSRKARKEHAPQQSQAHRSGGPP